MYLGILVSEEETKGLWELNVSQDSYLYFIFTLECKNKCFFNVKFDFVWAGY